MAGTSYWYLATDQWRYDGFGADELATPLGRGLFRDRPWPTASSRRRGSDGRLRIPPSIATHLISPTPLWGAGEELEPTVVKEARAGRLGFSCADPDAEENWPRVLTVWRANLLGSSGKGNEYFLHHLLGADAAIHAEETRPEKRPAEVIWHDEAPVGKLDLLVSLDFRMTSTGLFSDVLLPAATWYEKYDLSSTDMHPFVHAFNAAIRRRRPNFRS